MRQQEMIAEKEQEINGEKGRRPLRFPFQVEKREDVKWRRKGSCTMHATNFFKRHKMPFGDS